MSHQNETIETEAKMPSRTFISGNATVIIHSKLAWMTSEERRVWFESEWEKGNPILHNIARVIFE